MYIDNLNFVLRLSEILKILCKNCLVFQISTVCKGQIYHLVSWLIINVHCTTPSNCYVICKHQAPFGLMVYNQYMTIRY